MALNPSNSSNLEQLAFKGLTSRYSNSFCRRSYQPIFMWRCLCVKFFPPYNASTYRTVSHGLSDLLVISSAHRFFSVFLKFLYLLFIFLVCLVMCGRLSWRAYLSAQKYRHIVSYRVMLTCKKLVERLQKEHGLSWPVVLGEHTSDPYVDRLCWVFCWE